MTKRVRLTLIGLLAALFCFTLSTAAFLTVKADDAPTPVKLDKEEYFVIDETGKLTGLSSDGATAIANVDYFELVIPASVTKVTATNFSGNDKLVKVSFAVGSQINTLMRSKSYSAFQDSVSLKEVDLTNATQLTNLDGSFSGCTSLGTVIFAGSLENNATMSIEDSAFAKTALTSFEIPAYVTSISSYAFRGCTALKTINVAEGNTAFTYYTDGQNRYDQAVYKQDGDGNIESLAIAPPSMENIMLPYNAIKSIDVNYEVTDVTAFIEGLKSADIEENPDVYVYRNCIFAKEGGKFNDYAHDLILAPSAVEEITLPAEFIYTADMLDDDWGLPLYNFWYWLLDPSLGNLTKLKTIKVAEDNSVFTAFKGSLFKNDYSEFWVPYAATSFTFPAEMEINDFNFSVLSANSSLLEIKFEDDNQTYTSDNGLIYNKEKTELLFIPSGVTEFYVPATLQRIAENAYAVYNIHGARIANQIKNVYVENLEAWCKIDFGGRIETPDQYEEAPDGSLSKEKRAERVSELKQGYGINPMSGGADMYVQNEKGGWELLENLVLDFDGEISDLAFAGCKSLRTVTIGGKVTRIGEMSFAMCKNIRSISVPYVGCTQEYIETYNYIVYSTYVWELFGGKGMAVISNSVNYDFAPDKIDSITVTGYNILKETRGGTDSNKYAEYPVYIVPSNAFFSAPVRKITIVIDNTDGHDITFGEGLFTDSSVSEIDLENSNVSVLKESLLIQTDNITPSVKEITLPKTLKEIPELAFTLYGDGGDLEIVNIPEGVEYVDWNVFGDLDALVLPTTISGFGDIKGVKTVYLTGFTPGGRGINSSLFMSGIVVADDAEVYAEIPENIRVGYDWDDNANSAQNKIFYQADVVFQVQDSEGKVLAEKTEKHLASQSNKSKSYLQWAQTQGSSGSLYWALNESYALPDTVGNYKVDSAQWKLDGAEVTANTVLHGSEQRYVITQKLAAGESILLAPENVTIQYNGEAWKIPEGMEITSINVARGGNGYFYNSSSYFKKMPVDVGTYSVTATCKDGYEWYDESATSTPRTFTVQITPISVGVKWFYIPDGSSAGQDVSGTIPERMYDGNSVHSKIYAEFIDVSGKKRRVDFVNLSLYISGDRSMPVYSMTDVGTYEVTVNDSGNTADGEVWLGNYVIDGCLQFVINARVIDLNDYDTLAWGLSGYSSPLRDGNVYIYGGKPYVYEKPDVAPDSVVNVLNSIVRLREGTHTIEISNIPALLAGTGTQYNVTYHGGNSASDIGIYTASATLTVANGNYEFGYSLGGDLKSRGLTVTLEPDGTASVKKVWYIVRIDNGMLDSNTKSEYDIQDWTFGETPYIGMPRLEHGDEAAAFAENDKIHFTLKRNDTVVVSNFTREKFNYYINASMPVGDYELVCTVSDVIVGDHTHWFDDEAHNGAGSVLYHGFTRTIRFNVLPANINFKLTANGDNGYNNYDWQFIDGDRKQMFETFRIALVDQIQLVSVSRSGHWATNEANSYYGTSTVTYNLARMYNSAYHEYDGASMLGYISHPDTYKVYFNITAPNHNPLTDMGEGRYRYFFTVTAWQQFSVPSVSDVTYTGLKTLPTIAESEFYEIIWTPNDTYINGGRHSVSFKLYDGVHYRWEGVQGDTASVSFDIEKAENEWTRSPNIISWNYGGCERDVNRIFAVPKFLDSGKNVLFSIVNQDGTPVKDAEGKVIKELVNFTVGADGKVSQTVFAFLEKLNAGGYSLVSKVEGTGNYVEKVTSDTSFVVYPASNEWVLTPNIIRWSYGSYDKNVNLITGRAKLEVNPVQFRIYSSQQLSEASALTDWFTTENGFVNESVATVLGRLDHGTYFLVSKVDAYGNNYSGLDPQPQTFVIAKASNNWVVTPNVINWSYGSYDKNVNLILASARYSDAQHAVTFTVCTDAAGTQPVERLTSFTAVNGVVSDEVAEALKGLNYGTYYLISSVTYADGDNYASLTPKAMSFAVAKANNNWIVTPNVIRWSYGGFDKNTNLVLATASHTDADHPITFGVYTDEAGTKPVEGLKSFTATDGVVSDTVAAALNGLNHGTYYLISSVTYADSDNYESLSPKPLQFVVAKAINAWADGDDDLSLPSWVVGKYNPEENPIVVNAAFGKVNIVITDIDGNEYYNSVKNENRLNECGVGKYLLKAWVDEGENYAALAERTFTIEILDKVGLPWWGTLLITVGALGLAALIIFILWKKGVFQILTEKIVVAIRTKASVDATIASVRTAKLMEEGRQSVEDAKRRERIEQMRQKAAAQRALPPEERAAQLEERAQAEAAKAEKLRARSEKLQARAHRVRGSKTTEQTTTETEQEAPATDDTDSSADE